jgi:hypothetical protein
MLAFCRSHTLCLMCRCGCGVDGTSASAPLWNGIITLLNDWRFNHDLPSVGFINPLIYAKAATPATPALFQDIVTGNNGCNEQVCCPGQVTFGCWLNGEIDRHLSFLQGYNASVGTCPLAFVFARSCSDALFLMFRLGRNYWMGHPQRLPFCPGPGRLETTGVDVIFHHRSG